MERETSLPRAGVIRTIFLGKEAVETLDGRAERGSVVWEAKTPAQEDSECRPQGGGPDSSRVFAQCVISCQAGHGR